SGSMKKRKPTRPNFEADEPSSAGAGGPFKAVVQERSPSQSTDVHAGREDQLKYVEQDPESYARKKWRVEQNAGISLIELQDRPPQAQALQNISIPTGQSKEVCNELATSLQEYGSHDAQVTRLLIAERQRQLTQSYKARIRQLKDDLSLSRKDVTSIQSNMPEALVEKNSQIVAPKKQLARSASGPASLQEHGMVLTDQSNVADCSNQLCDLPDEVLLQILSFLPLKDAVRTSVLSKRWEQLWAFVPDLHFKNSDLSKRPLFLDFVGRACALRGESAVREVSLSCEVGGAVYRIKTLITSIVTRSVEDLSLFLPSPKRPYLLPSSIFMCATLERLLVQSHCFIKLHSSICLSKLKVLILSEVIFEDSDSVEKLFSLPLLEKLVVGNCYWRKLKSIRISAPKLQHLCINILPRGSFGRLVQINGACLKSFHYHGGPIDEYCISGDTRQLVKAKLLLYPGRGSREVAQGYKLLSVFSNVKELALSDTVVQDLPTGYELPLFSNMIKLKLGGINSSTINGVWALVRRSPRLQSLYFRQGVNYYPEIGRDELLHPLPSCFFTELKKISLVIFHGRYGRKQLFMVGIFLEKALALREMVIHVAEYCIGKENLLKDLNNISKGSKKCRISLQQLVV
ncbi:hypothetical protein CRG98_029920, partial [Punica granatum]